MSKTVAFIIRLALLVLGLVIGYFIGYNSGTAKAEFKHEYRPIEEIRAELKTRENGTILDYIKGSAKVETKDEGTLFTIKYVQYLTGTLTNNAALATAKDVKLRVNYYSKTNSIIGNQEFTIFEYIKPGQTINFKERVSVPEQVAEFKFQIIEANSNN